MPVLKYMLWLASKTALLSQDIKVIMVGSFYLMAIALNAQVKKEKKAVTLAKISYVRPCLYHGIR